MKQNDMYPSPWLGSDDIADGATLSLVIKRITQEEMINPKTQEKESKTVLHFENVKGEDQVVRAYKPMILNKTNGKVMFQHYADDSDNWPGKTIVLGKAWENNFGEMGWRLQILPPGAAVAAALTAAPVVAASPMVTLREFVAAETSGPLPAPAQVLRMLKDAGYAKKAPVATDLDECKEKISGWLADHDYQLPPLDQPKPGQTSNETHTPPTNVAVENDAAMEEIEKSGKNPFDDE